MEERNTSQEFVASKGKLTNPKKLDESELEEVAGGVNLDIAVSHKYAYFQFAAKPEFENEAIVSENSGIPLYYWLYYPDRNRYYLITGYDNRLPYGYDYLIFEKGVYDGEPRNGFWDSRRAEIYVIPHG